MPPIPGESHRAASLNRGERVLTAFAGGGTTAGAAAIRPPVTNGAPHGGGTGPAGVLTPPR